MEKNNAIYKETVNSYTERVSNIKVVELADRSIF